jgi:RHS repeat-associated protein
MGEQRAATGQTIALPTGGGAIQGLGESFTPDLQTGTGNLSVPIAIPAGRNGFQPHLSLDYSTGNGNGPFGLGWLLRVPHISRKTRTGVPRYRSDDPFVLAGLEDLVPMAGGPSEVTQHRPRIEGFFARILHHQAGADDYWEVRTRDGFTSLYGTPGKSGSDPTTIADPQVPSRVFSWRLTQTTDPFGNRIVFRWVRDVEREDGPHRWDQLYLERVSYIDYGDPEQLRFLVTVAFEYEPRPDPFSDYRAGFEIRTVQRCVRIRIATHAEALPTPVRTYHLRYLDQLVPVAERPLNEMSMLGEIDVEGHDGTVSATLPPLRFGYTAFDPAVRRFQPVAAAHGVLPEGSLADPTLELVDLFGRGLPDIVQIDGVIRYWRNLGGGAFDGPRELAEAPIGVSLADRGVAIADLDGDGRSDLLVTSRGRSGYHPLQGQGWDRRSFVAYERLPTVDFDALDVRFIDLDGNGVIDAMRTGPRFELYHHDRESGWSEVELRGRRPLQEFPDVSFADPRIKVADMTGDGLADIVLISNGRVDYWPYLGHGRWGQRVTMAGAPRFEDAEVFPLSFDPARALVGDVDGDGVADVVYVGSGHVTVWTNRAGNGFADPITIHGTPTVAGANVRLVDLLGTGTAGILWTWGRSARPDLSAAFLDLTGGTKPYLLDRIDNNLGARTRVTYRASTELLLQDEHSPTTRWSTPLPFPVQVVAATQVADAVSATLATSSYGYHHGYWDGRDREFRGFARVDQFDTLEPWELPGSPPPGDSARAPPDDFSPPVETRTWFHVGPVGEGSPRELDLRLEYWPGDLPTLDRPEYTDALLARLSPRDRRDALRSLRGRILREEVYSRDGTDREDRPFSVTERIHGIREEQPPAPGETRRRIFFPHQVGQRATHWERGNDPMTRLVFEGAYDQFGQPTRRTEVAVPRGRDLTTPGPAGDPYLVTHTILRRAQRDDAEHYLVDRVASTTSWEILNDGSPSVTSLIEAIFDGTAPRRIIAQTLQYYDGPAFEGLPFGDPGDRGAPTRTETLVLPDGLLAQAYRSRDAVSFPPEIPPYLHEGPEPPVVEYPAEFLTLLPANAGYMHRDPSDENEGGWYSANERRQYDFQGDGGGTRGMVLLKRDALGNDTTIAYDDFDLLPLSVTDPAGLVTAAEYDYRVLQPRVVTNPNGNRTAYGYEPLGHLDRVWVMGKVGEAVGDTEAPSRRWLYDRTAFADRGEPASIRSINRIHHASDTSVPPAQRDQTIESVEYSDGFGRLLQTRTTAPEVLFGIGPEGDAGLPPDLGGPLEAARGTAPPSGEVRVAVSGWQLFDNKGRVITRFEPFLSTGWAYAAVAEAERGVRTRFVYDPLGRLIRTLHPDRSQSLVVYGVPDDLADPDRFEPTPWETYRYDRNDNAGRTHGAAAAAFDNHWNTPASETVDALGRVVESVIRNGTDAADHFTSRNRYSLRGDLIEHIDELDRVALRQLHDLGGRPLRIEAIDAGTLRLVYHAAGDEIERRDSRGALRLRASDALRRTIRVWARDREAESVTLRERTIYGDSPDFGPTPAAARAANLLGQVVEAYDEAGLVVVEARDFLGNALRKTRQVVADAVLLAATGTAMPFRIDWDPPAGTSLQDHAQNLLDPVAYQTTTTYDALGRATRVQLPEDVTGNRRYLSFRYAAGDLDRVEFDGSVFVERIAYDAHDRRILTVYGNGIMVRHRYDPETGRLARTRVERFIRPDPDVYAPVGPPLMDLMYGWDPVGNLFELRERTPGSGIPATPAGRDALDRLFHYDPLYRLVRATGRECDVSPPAPWDPGPRCTDPNRVRPYEERYQHDPVGNLVELRHLHSRPDGTIQSFRRVYEIAPGGNRLVALRRTAGDLQYEFDEAGHLTKEAMVRRAEWDHADRLRRWRVQTDGALPSVEAVYLYDTTGERVKKLVRSQGGPVTTSVYVDGVYEHRRRTQGGGTDRQDVIHVGGSLVPVAMVRLGDPFPDDPMPAVTYRICDHVNSDTLTLDGEGNVLTREEYSPFGETTFGSFSHKRYRFAGKERDWESGLYAMGARYYAPWLCRFICTDPLGMVDGSNLYRYANGNPLTLVDPSGTQAAGSSAEPAAPPPEDLSRILQLVQHSRRIEPPHEAQPMTDPGRMTVTGVRDPTTPGRALAPRQYYSNAVAAAAAAAGYTEWAELVEAGHGCAACHVTHNINRIPTNEELDLGRYNDVARGMYVARATLEFALTVGQARASWQPTTAAPVAPPRSAPQGTPTGGTAPRTAPAPAAPATGSPPTPARLPQDVNVNPAPPQALPLNRPVGRSPTQNAQVQADIASARAQGATDFRVNQQQVNGAGQRVGTNRPDLQYTDANGQRVYIEYDRPGSLRGPVHRDRTLANDPSGQVILKTVP